jgi:hypothetical protein
VTDDTDDPNDPLLRPASDAGWDDVPAAKPAVVTPVAQAVVVTPAAQPVVVTPAAQPVVVTPAAQPVVVTPAALVVTAASEPGPAVVVTDAVIAPAVETIAAPTETIATTAVSTEPSPAASTEASPAVSTEASPAVSTEASPAASTEASPKPAAPAATDAKPAAATAATDAKPAAADAKPLLPATYDENELRAAVGATPLATTRPALRKRHVASEYDDDSEPSGPNSRKTVAITVLGVAAVLGIAAMVIVGRFNSDRYLLVCTADRAAPQQGRAFPPWGEHSLEGEAWRPLKITAETRCQPHETDDITTLQRLYLTMILDQATTILAAREVTRLDEADVLLKQALLLTRPPEHESEALATERNEHHKNVERMLGDVAYWRATARVRDAAAQLAEAAKQFERAAAQRPRHVSDAATWATYAQKIAQQLRAGPTGTAPSAPGAPPALATDRPTSPPGVALPIEPERPAVAEPPAASEPPSAPPDAGAPTGGVLL